MPSLTFPSNPLVGDIYTLGTRAWRWNGTAWQLQSSVQSLDPFTVIRGIVTTSTNSTSTSSGGLIVYGGVGVGQDLWATRIYATEIYQNGVRFGIVDLHAGTGIAITTSGVATYTITNIGVTSLTGSAYIGVSSSTGSVTLTNLGVQTLTAGTDTAVSSNTGTITVWNTSTLQSVTNRGSTTNNVIRITNSTTATSTSTGALIVNGGASFNGDLWINGLLYSSGAPILTTTTFGLNFNSGTDISIIINGGTGAVTISNTSTLQTVTGRGSTTTNRVTFANTVNATSTSTGAILVTGGIGVAKDIYSGGTITSNNIVANSGLTIGNSLYNYFTSPAITSNATVNLDAFAVDAYRTAKYLVQVVDTGFTPNLIHSAEILVTHDHGGFSTTGYIVQYGVVTNYGELGTWDSAYQGGLLQLQFTPNYTPTSMTIKVNRTVITT
jgi:hypothetical protein